MNRFCDEDCNHCPVILHGNNRQLTVILNALLLKFGEEVYAIVQRNCPNLTVCRDCLVDDFVHVECCDLLREAKEQEEVKP